MPRVKSARKPTKAEEALNALLGLSSKAEEAAKHSIGKFYGVSEAELQDFREAQGLIYFLMAPALFHPKECKHCKEPFIVSRMFVACCSYTCIRKDLESRGFRWEKGRDIEAVIMDPQVYDGNEPIWIRGPNLHKALEVLTNLLQKSTEESPTPLSPPSPVSPEKSSTTMKQDTDSLPAPSTTIGTGPIVKKTSSTKKKPSRKIIFGG